MTIPIYQVDAFTDEPFGGNPATVCLLREFPDDDWLQNVAAEMNLSETAFLQKVSDGYQLRWFTPKVEVELCGHATLASAHVLWQENHAANSAPIVFHTLSGTLHANHTGDCIELDFPTKPPTECDPPVGLLQALGTTARYVGRNQFDMLVEVDDESALRNLQPDFAALSRVEARGVIVTSLADSNQYDFVSRFFAPAAGINEDPVTGSAHCCLGVYWQRRLEKSQFVAYQASPRGGVVHVRVDGERTILGGRAVTVLRGTLEATI